LIRILNVAPDHYSPKARSILQSVGEVQETALDRGDLIVAIKDFDVLITRFGVHVDKEIIRAGSRLKAIVTAATGVDHIDVGEASEHGIEVLSLRGETEFLKNVHASAEHTWALLMALVKKIPAAVKSVEQGEWNRDLFRGHEFFGKVLGVVGYGRIGEKVTSYGLAFGMSVLVYDPYRSQVPPPVKKCSFLKDLLISSDVVSLHVPLNDETKLMIGKTELRMMRPGAYLINTSRGMIIDEEALLEALSREKIGGAAVDVLSNESNLGEKKLHPMVEYAKMHTNLLITPHIGGATHESMEKTEIFMAEKLRRCLWERKLINQAAS
jgi:D-3-phosphoglycerate dehydrogenase / 2-oxoglutarate reductase